MGAGAGSVNCGEENVWTETLATCSCSSYWWRGCARGKGKGWRGTHVEQTSMLCTIEHNAACTMTNWLPILLTLFAQRRPLAASPGSGAGQP